MEGGGSGGGIRLHVGGLGETVGREDLLKIFSPMGSVDAVEFVRTKGRSFAYIDFSPSSNSSLTKLFSTYNGCIWKGGRLRLEKAKEHYLARLKREWEESASASDDTVKAPENPTPSTHLNIFFPRLRKVKAMPLSGTGKHKYSFQRVAVPSVLPKTFCDCEEHSASLTPQETHARDLEALNVGINEEEVNVMNSVMNKLFEKNNITVSKKDDIIIDTKDNIIINVVSNGNDMMDTELEILSRKRKSVLDEIPAGGVRYTKRLEGNHINPSKKRQSIIPEGSEKQEATQAVREKKKPSEVAPDKSSDEEPSRTTGVKRSNDNITWSQKSSWKALVANGNSSDFSVSSFLPTASSSKAVQPASGNTNLAGLPSQDTSEESDVPSSAARSIVKTKIKKTKSKRLTSTVMAGNFPVAHDIERNGTAATDAIGSDHSEDAVAADINMDAELLELAPSTEGNGEDDNLNAGKGENAAEDLNVETESLVLKDDVDHDVDEEETGKGPLEPGSKSTGGSTWLQRASWTQLVSGNDASFSITQLVPTLASEKSEAARTNSSGDGQFSNSNQSGSGMKQRDYSCSPNGFEAAAFDADSTPVRSLEETRQSLKGKNVSEGCRLGAKKPVRRKIESGETCAFMRSSTSKQEWAKAKKAVSEPRRKKKIEE